MVKYCVDIAIVTQTPVKVDITAASMDSDLEAFSHNPVSYTHLTLPTIYSV